MNPLILNREFKLPEDGWIHVAPLGEFPHSSGVVQVIDSRAVKQMVERFDNDARKENFPGLLVDFDHFSDDQGKPSEAAGWISKLEARKAGLFANVRWSDVGQTAVMGGRYRLVSPVFNRKDTEALTNSTKPGERLRPIRLVKVALTNDPNLRGMEPLSNRSGTTPAAETTNEPTTKMQTVLTKLGLAAEASEETVLAAVTTISNRATTAEAALPPLTNRVTALEAEKTTLATENAALLADVFATKYANRFTAEKVESAKVEFIKNRAGFETIMNAAVVVEANGEAKPEAGTMKCPKCGETISIPMENRKSGIICNRATARQPDTSGGHKANEKAIAQKVDFIRNRDRCDYATAFNRMRDENPELVTNASE
jgi:phage I-like protein